MRSAFPPLHAAMFPLILVVSLLITGCISGTRDIEGRDNKTLVAGASYQKTLSERTALDINYIITGGNNTQPIINAVQFEGTRLTEGTLRNRFTMQALTANYKYNLANGERLKFHIAPGLKLSHAHIDVDTDTSEAGISSFEPGYGFKIGGSWKFNDQLSLISQLGLYQGRDSDHYSHTGIWLGYDFQPNTQLQFGYSYHFLGDSRSGNRDECNSSDNTANECQDSKLEIESSGIHFGIKFLID